jgi:glycosyltransferase involved in cell wall biosynthesis
MKKKLVVGITAPGSVVLIAGQLKYFKELGYETYLLAPNHPSVIAYCATEECIHLPVDFEREIAPLKDIKAFFQVIKHLKRVQPDVVNLGTPKVSLLGMIVSRMLGIKKRIYTCRGYRFEHEKGLKRTLLILNDKFVCFLSHHVICISNSVKQLGLDNQIFSDTKAILINKGSSNGVNLDLFKRDKINQEAREEFIQKYNLNNKFVFGFVGRVIDRKGVNELYTVFEELSKQYPEIVLLMIGPYEKSQLKDPDLQSKYESHPNIISLGKINQEEIPLYMTLMDVFVLPAWWEGFGNVLIQAAAVNVPVISTTGTGTIDAVEDGFNGVLIPVADVSALKKAMLQLYTDKELREKYGNNGLVWVKNFDRFLIWNEMDKIYKS